MQAMCCYTAMDQICSSIHVGGAEDYQICIGHTPMVRYIPSYDKWLLATKSDIKLNSSRPNALLSIDGH